MGNLDYYNKFRAVPAEAQKPIQAGRLKGFTDINPMWRLKVLTEIFGPVGIGWYYEIKRTWTEPGAKDEIAAFVEVNLYFKHEGEWSQPIPGVGGNIFVASESKGLHTSDECYKMALTDALSVACKALGIGADIYYAKDRSKYDVTPFSDNGSEPKVEPPSKPLSEAQCKRYFAIAKKAGFDTNAAKQLVAKRYNKDDVSRLTKEEYDGICGGLETNPEGTMQWYKKKIS